MRLLEQLLLLHLCDFCFVIIRCWICHRSLLIPSWYHLHISDHCMCWPLEVSAILIRFFDVCFLNLIYKEFIILFNLIQFGNFERALSWHELNPTGFIFFSCNRSKLLISSLISGVQDFWLSASSRVIHARAISLNLADCIALFAEALFHLFGDNVSIAGFFSDLYLVAQTFGIWEFRSSINTETFRWESRWLLKLLICHQIEILLSLRKLTFKLVVNLQQLLRHNLNSIIRRKISLTFKVWIIRLFHAAFFNYLLWHIWMPLLFIIFMFHSLTVCDHSLLLLWIAFIHLHCSRYSDVILQLIWELWLFFADDVMVCFFYGFSSFETEVGLEVLPCAGGSWRIW